MCVIIGRPTHAEFHILVLDIRDISEVEEVSEYIENMVIYLNAYYIYFLNIGINS